MNPRVLELNINIFDISICKETRAHARATRRETRVPSGGISFIICLFFILFFFSLSRWLTQTFSILVPLPASESEREREAARDSLEFVARAHDVRGRIFCQTEMSCASPLKVGETTMRYRGTMLYYSLNVELISRQRGNTQTLREHFLRHGVR